MFIQRSSLTGGTTTLPDRVCVGVSTAFLAVSGALISGLVDFPSGSVIQVFGLAWAAVGLKGTRSLRFLRIVPVPVPRYRIEVSVLSV